MFRIIKTIKVPSKEQVSQESQAIFDQLEKRVGKVPNLYATIGYSSHALKALLDLEAELYHSKIFRAKDREAISLIVSQTNGCDYCLASHTELAIKFGFTKEETLAIRKAQFSNVKLNAAIMLALSLAENKGKADTKLLGNFFDVGYNEAALMELIGLVVLRSFTNYAYSSTKIPIDYPLAEPI